MVGNGCTVKYRRGFDETHSNNKDTKTTSTNTPHINTSLTTFFVLSLSGKYKLTSFSIIMAATNSVYQVVKQRVHMFETVSK